MHLEKDKYCVLCWLITQGHPIKALKYVKYICSVV